MSTILYRCQRCGRDYQLDYNYLSQYGGQTTNCASCAQPMRLPTLADVGMQPTQPIPVMQQLQSQPGVLSYATPGVGQAPGLPAWRKGGTLIVAKKTQLPYCCLKCAAPGSGGMYRRVLYWHSGWVYLALLPGLVFYLLPGLLIYAIVALCVQEKGSFEFALCDVHRAKRRNNILIAIAVTVASVVLFFIGDRDLRPMFISFGIIGVLIGLIVWVIQHRVVTAKRIDPHYLWVKGAGKPFLETLPTAS